MAFCITLGIVILIIGLVAWILWATNILMEPSEYNVFVKIIACIPFIIIFAIWFTVLYMDVQRMLR